MYLDELRSYCLSKPHVSEGFPFDHTTLVFKVDGKLFALVDTTVFEQVNLKCDPDLAIELREQYQGVTPGYHMNKKHWNTVRINEDVPDDVVYTLVDESYRCVIATLSKKRQHELAMG